MKNITNIGLGFAFLLSSFLLPSPAKAQTTATAKPQDQSSLGEYARKVQKDSTTAKPKPKVFDNDNLPKDDKISIVGVETPPAKASDASAVNEKEAGTGKPKTPSSAASSSATSSAATSADDEQAKNKAVWKEWQQKLTAQKQQIDLASRELDVLQREYELRAAAMYADVGNRLRNSAQWDKQEAQYKQQIADKQKAVEEAKQKLQDMQEEARKAGVPNAMID
jgi:hypothetical protein